MHEVALCIKSHLFRLAINKSQKQAKISSKWNNLSLFYFTILNVYLTVPAKLGAKYELKLYTATFVPGLAAAAYWLFPM